MKEINGSLQGRKEITQFMFVDGWQQDKYTWFVVNGLKQFFQAIHNLCCNMLHWSSLQNVNLSAAVLLTFIHYAPAYA